MSLNSLHTPPPQPPPLPHTTLQSHPHNRGPRRQTPPFFPPLPPPPPHRHCRHSPTGTPKRPRSPSRVRVAGGAGSQRRPVVRTDTITAAAATPSPPRQGCDGDGGSSRGGRSHCQGTKRERGVWRRWPPPHKPPRRVPRKEDRRPPKAGAAALARTSAFPPATTAHPQTREERSAAPPRRHRRHRPPIPASHPSPTRPHRPHRRRAAHPLIWRDGARAPLLVCVGAAAVRPRS